MSGIKLLKGFKDILPEEVIIWQNIETKARDIAQRFDFFELRVPILEKTELFARGIGEATDIVEKEMYTFKDRQDEFITLRPEATAGMVRAVLENNLIEGARPTKVWCMGPMFRYENPQKGRQRQFHQLDFEVFGDGGPYIDSEIISLLDLFLKELGLTKLSVNINSLGCPECRPSFHEKLLNYFKSKEKTLCPDCQRRLYKNPLRIIDCKNETCKNQVEDAPKTIDNLCLNCKEHFEKVLNNLTALNLNYTVNPYLVRGLDYYTKTAFEILSGEIGAQNAVAGGGRYDGLAKQLGNVETPGIGFAIGLERLAMLLKQLKDFSAQGPNFYIAILSPEALDIAFSLTNNLRALGKTVAVDWENGSLKSRMKRADKSKAEKVIMLGENEIKNNEVTIRNLSNREQTTLSLSDYKNF